MRGTILKVHTATGDVFWQVPASGDVVTKGPQAAAEYKLSVNKTGNDIAGTMTKLSELSTATHVVTHAIRGVLRATSGHEGEQAKLTVAGVAASITPVANATLTQLTLAAGGGAGVDKGVEEALRAAGLTWVPWGGCTSEQALVPTGTDMPTVAAAASGAMGVVDIGGQDDYAAQAAVASLGIANAGMATTVGDVAAMVAGWAGCPERAAALAVLLGVGDDSTERRKKTKAAAGEVLSAVRDRLSKLTNAQAATVGKARAELAALGIAPNGSHVAQWLVAIPSDAPPALAGGAPLAAAAAIVAPGMATSRQACNAEAELRLSGVAGVDATTKATMVAALAQQLASEGFGDAAVAKASVGFDPIRIVGAERMSPEDVLQAVAGAMATTAVDLAEAIAAARGAAKRPALFTMARPARVAAMAAEDLQHMATKSGTTFEGAPTSWEEASERVADIIDAFARLGAETSEVETTARGRGGAAKVERAEEGTKIHYSATRNGSSAAGILLNPLLTPEFARKESMAVPLQDEYAEARRLCLHAGAEGRGCEAHLLSDGKYSGSIAKGNAPSSVVCAREALDVAIQQEIEDIDGDTLTAEAGDGIGTLSQGMLTGTLNTKLVVKLLGAQKETTTELGGRTVLSHAKFGSMTGAPHPSMHGGVGRHRHPRAPACGQQPPTPQRTTVSVCARAGGRAARLTKRTRSEACEGGGVG